WEAVGEGYKFTEGPAVDRQGNVFFTDVGTSKIYKIDNAGKVTLFAENTARTNGLMFGSDGRLYGCRNGDKKIVAYNADGTVQTIAEDVHSNDLVVASDGGIYFTDPPNEQVWFIDPQGNKRVVASGFRPNGIILWPDESTLVVTDSAEPHLWTFRIEADGSLKFKERYYHPLVIPPSAERPGSDGMTVDKAGRLYVATRAGLQMFDTTGRLGGVIAKPQDKFLSNVVFGGPKFDTLYVTCSDKVYRRKTKTTGAPYFLRGKANAKSGEKLFVASPLTKPKEFTSGIEGPACDAAGNIYAVNFKEQHTIGKVTPEGKGEVFLQLPNKSTGNGIRFDRAGFMYIADYVNHNVLKVDMKSRKISVLGHEDRMNQPNDLAIGPDGVLYASDPNWGESTGQLWRIDSKGKVSRLAENMGTTNGIEVSPDGKILYVNESAQRNIWAFTITDEGKLADKRLLKKFPDHGFDGMRCDVDGNLYVTRYGKGTVVKLSPKGEILREIDVLGARPSNICFGGPDGRTAYVTEVEHQRLVQFRVDRPGLAWQRWRESR
ncbi:MAG: SMP-30/gluconolactonase/LRE family protein, partial [Planctomycetes bacterium]|nr:SMP-30/gluconolactonase/LRE family protein [Planctomycetota bacterium]